MACMITAVEKVSARLVRHQIEHSIPWQGNPLSTVQTFGTPSYRLRSKERLETHKRARFKRATLINERTNLFEACNHKPSFHQCKVDECTDETQESQKGPAESVHRALVSALWAVKTCVHCCQWGSASMVAPAVSEKWTQRKCSMMCSDIQSCMTQHEMFL